MMSRPPTLRGIGLPGSFSPFTAISESPATRLSRSRAVLMASWRFRSGVGGA